MLSHGDGSGGEVPTKPTHHPRRVTESSRSDFGYLSPGLLLTLGGDRTGALTGVGGELSYMYFAHRDAVGVGLFTQAQYYSGGAGRYAGGIQFGNMLGLELGYAYRQASSGLPAVPGVHVASFLSFGYVVMSLRASAPLDSGAEDAVGMEAAFTLALKRPFVAHGIDGRRPWLRGMFGGG